MIYGLLIAVGIVMAAFNFLPIIGIGLILSGGMMYIVDRDVKRGR